MNFVKSLMIKFLIGNKDAIIAMALKELAKMYKQGKAQLATKLVEIIKDSPLAETATKEEVDTLLFTLEEWFRCKQFNAVELAIFAMMKKS